MKDRQIIRQERRAVFILVVLCAHRLAQGYHAVSGASGVQFVPVNGVFTRYAPMT